jgi:hypothetical protein
MYVHFQKGNKNSLESLPKSEIPILSLILIKNLGVRIIRVFKLKRRKKDSQLMNHKIHHSQNLQVWIHCRSEPSRFGMAREHVEEYGQSVDCWTSQI